LDARMTENINIDRDGNGRFQPGQFHLGASETVTKL
jgi:hypothetical protein